MKLPNLQVQLYEQKNANHETPKQKTCLALASVSFLDQAIQWTLRCTSSKSRWSSVYVCVCAKPMCVSLPGAAEFCKFLFPPLPTFPFISNSFSGGSEPVVLSEGITVAPLESRGASQESREEHAGLFPLHKLFSYLQAFPQVPSVSLGPAG